MSFLFLINICKLRRKKLITILWSDANLKCMCSKLTNSSRKSLYKTKEVKKIRFYVLHRTFEYLKSYNMTLERKFPRAMRLYRLFVEGMKDFYTDFKAYLKMVHSLNLGGNNLNNFTLKEIELYQQMPKDMRQIAPLLILSILPFANYVIFPIAYYFPRQLLCRHFWNLQQKSEFSVISLQKRLTHNKPVFRHLQLQLPYIQADFLYDKWSTVLGTIGSGSQPEPLEILHCKKLFETGPYNLMYLSGNHVRHLLKIHDVPLGWFRRTRLGDRAIILQAMDRSIMKEGIDNISHDSLRNACLIRGLNPTNMNYEDMIKWMKKWLIVSCDINKSSLSLLLHCPILLAYNEPTNWQLIYPNKSEF